MIEDAGVNLFEDQFDIGLTPPRDELFIIWQDGSNWETQQGDLIVATENI